MKFVRIWWNNLNDEERNAVHLVVFSLTVIGLLLLPAFVIAEIMQNLFGRIH